LSTRLVGIIVLIACASVRADAFYGYQLVDQFVLPGGGGPVDAMPDGRIVAAIIDEVYVETAPGSRTFSPVGTLPAADVPSWGAAFLRVSPDGARLAVGNNGGTDVAPDYRVGVFAVASLTGVWFAAPHFDAEWIDDRYLALTTEGPGGTSRVTGLDTESVDVENPTNPVIVENIGGASGGIDFDGAMRLYTGNGFSLSGPSGTGATKAFDHADWSAALTGGTTPDFETGGVLVVDILSASPLVIDNEGHLIVGGGDSFGSGEGDFAAVIHSRAVSDALAGLGTADPQDPTEVRPLDPDSRSDSNFYSVYCNDTRNELYLRDFGSAQVFVYVDTAAVPTVSTWGLVVLALLVLVTGTVVQLRVLHTPRLAGRAYMLRAAIVMMTCVVYADQVNAEPFAATVIDYQPAPGQYVNIDTFNDPTEALGAPTGAGTAQANNISVVTLGGFGGAITLAFAETVLDDPLNPFGMDAIVFGNAFWVGGDPNTRWAECGVIEIAQDLDDDGRPDDNEPWYLISGSHLTDPLDQRAEQTWDDDVGDETYPPEFSSWIPFGESGTWTTAAYALPSEVFGQPSVIRNPSGDPSAEGIFGYADYSPTLVLGDTNADNLVDDPAAPAAEFYTTPDDPLTTGVTEGSGGGDAFDIAWAIDPETRNPAGLDGFDFIRITTAVNAVDQGHIVNEKSVEIDAVADVSPDPFGDYDDDGDIDLYDAGGVQLCFETEDIHGTDCARLDRQPDDWIDHADVAAFVPRLSGPVAKP
jgi:hypothetical protein